MNEDQILQLDRILDECYKFSQIAPYKRFKITYDKHQRFSDRGKLALDVIHHHYSS